MEVTYKMARKVQFVETVCHQGSRLKGEEHSFFGAFLIPFPTSLFHILWVLFLTNRTY